MSLIKCPDCGKKVSGKAKVCPNCGYPISNLMEEKNQDTITKINKAISEEKVNQDTILDTNEECSEEEENRALETNDVMESDPKVKKQPPVRVLFGVIVIIIIGGIATYFATSNIRAYSKANKLYEQNKYDEAMDVYSSIEDYKDSKSLIERCKELYAIQTDKIAPVITYNDKNTIIEVTCGTEFNLNKYLSDKISISDDVTKDLKDYVTKCDDEVYDSISGVVNTMVSGEFPVELSAKDEAGNVGTFDLTLELNPIHVTKDNPAPIVYDGEYGTVKILSFSHGEIYGENQYYMIFEVENKTDKKMVVNLSSETYINDYQIKTYHTWTSGIGSDKKGKQESLIYDEDIPSDIGDITTIESIIRIAESDEVDSYFRVPIIFDVNVSN